LRKAIKLTLLEPSNEEYRQFTDRLLEIYRKACRVQRDRRLGDAGRAAKVAALDDEILELCGPDHPSGGARFADLSPSDGPANDYRLLVNELMKLMLAEQLFTFVTAAAVETPTGDVAPVAGTNNEAERTLRSPAMSARRQTILHSILESIRQYLPEFTLGTVVAEIARWSLKGRSCFRELARSLGLEPPERPVLDAVLPT